jgi:hypothetical protein
VGLREAELAKCLEVGDRYCRLGGYFTPDTYGLDALERALELDPNNAKAREQLTLTIRSRIA